MNEDRFMRELGKVARDESDAPVEDAGELARPFSRAELDAMIARSTHALGLPHDPSRRALSPRGRAKPALAAGGAMVAALAMAAAVALFLRAPRPDEAAPTVYDLVVEGAARTTRAAGQSTPPEGAVRVDRGGALTLLLRPRSPSSTLVGARALVGEGAEARLWDLPCERSAEGSLKLEASASRLVELPGGPSRVVLFVGPPPRLPADVASARALIQRGDPRVQLLSLDLRIAP